MGFEFVGRFEICSPIMCIRLSLCSAGVLTWEAFFVLYIRKEREGERSKENTTQQGVPRASEGSSRYVAGSVSFGVVQCV
jgi:hypothetical protein